MTPPTQLTLTPELHTLFTLILALISVFSRVPGLGHGPVPSLSQPATGASSGPLTCLSCLLAADRIEWPELQLCLCLAHAHPPIAAGHKWSRLRRKKKEAERWGHRTCGDISGENQWSHGESNRCKCGVFVTTGRRSVQIRPSVLEQNILSGDDSEAVFVICVFCLVP